MRRRPLFTPNRRCATPTGASAPNDVSLTPNHWNPPDFAESIAPVNRPIPAMPAAPAAKTRRIRFSAMPPSAMTGNPAALVIAANRANPSTEAPAWLSVANTGDNRTASAPIRRARLAARRPCADAQTNPRSRRAMSVAFQFASAASGICTPSASRRSGGCGAASSNVTPCARASPIRPRAMSAAVSGSGWRTTTALSGGRCGMIGAGSGRRVTSLMTIHAGTGNAGRVRARRLSWRRVVVNVRSILSAMAEL